MSTEQTSDGGDTLGRRRLIQMMAGAAVFGLAACGDDGPDRFSPFARIADEPNGGATLVAEVLIPANSWDPANADTAFSPNVITVGVGTTVTWVNNDTLFHTVTSGISTGELGKAGTPDGKFDSGEIQAGETYQRTFDEAGTFDYFCTPHPWMIGQVIVTA